MKHSFKNRMQYKFEQFMAKGGTSIFISLLVAFLVCFGIIILIRGVVVWAVDPGEYNTVTSFWDHMWYTFLQMTDPGNMYQDSFTTGWIRITTVIAGFTGVILFSALIAFITTALDNLLYEFRKGRGKILENEHTLILGWNERVVDILRELIIANESEDYASVVILSSEDKEKMDDFIAKRLPDTQTTKIITSNGNSSNINELERVSAADAKSVIIMASSSDSAPEEEKLLSDTQAIKTIMALLSCQKTDKSEIPVIAEIFTSEKRDIVNFFDDENLIAIDSWDIMGKLLVQTSLTSGLEIVYREILSFDLSEVYFYEADWNGIKFSELPYHFADGIPLGIHKEDGSVQLRPEDDVTLEDGDEILILANDDSTIDFQQKKLYTPKDLEYNHKGLEQRNKKVLILGWHHVGNIFVRECDDYLKEGSVFDVMINNPSDEIKTHIDEIDVEYPDIKITLYEQNTLEIENLRKLNPFDYDTILILSQDPDEQSAEKIDSDTLMILLLLRKIKKDLGGKEVDTKIITQVLNSENQDLIAQTEVDDFVISNKLITMILAQLSEEPNIKKLYDDIFEEDGSEIYVKPASLYFDNFPITADFATILGQARKRDEICLGLRYGDLSKDSTQNFGVVLNSPKDDKITLTENDFLVVLAEDEL